MQVAERSKDIIISHFNCNNHVVFIELPKTATAKIQKFRLRQIG
jgi:acyl-coenzyme A synthetase/AMP-(fatty) acid ligase